MRRTTIMLPAGLQARAERLARRRGLSLGALIREALTAEVEGSRLSFLDREIVYDGPVPEAAPKHHDDIYDGARRPRGRRRA